MAVPLLLADQADQSFAAAVDPRQHGATWTGMPTTLTSVDDVEAAPDRGEIDVQSLDVVLNAPVVKWSDVPP